MPDLDHSALHPLFSIAESDCCWPWIESTCAMPTSMPPSVDWLGLHYKEHAWSGR